MSVVLYRRSLDARSGAGQLLEMQWRGLRAAGVDVLLAGARGTFRFWLRTGVRAHRRSLTEIERMRERGAIVVDHGLSVPSAELVFVHNVAAEAARHVPSAALSAAVRREREFFRALAAGATVVANSKLVVAALHEHFGLARERVTVLYPGYQSKRYTPQRAAALRDAARRSLGVDAGTPLVGFVTSGDFAKRGLDLFLDCAARIAAARPEVRFLVVGSKRLSDEAREHALVRAGAVRYRPKSRHPERWFAALDLFVYAARFEEFGIVVAEAQAMGVPVLTSRLVGASECLPNVYDAWVLDRPEPSHMAERALAMLADAAVRARLSAAAVASISTFSDHAYVEGTQAILGAQNLRLK